MFTQHCSVNWKFVVAVDPGRWMGGNLPTGSREDAACTRTCIMAREEPVVAVTPSTQSCQRYSAVCKTDKLLPVDHSVPPSCEGIYLQQPPPIIRALTEGVGEGDGEGDGLGEGLGEGLGGGDGDGEGLSDGGGDGLGEGDGDGEGEGLGEDVFARGGEYELHLSQGRAFRVWSPFFLIETRPY